MSTCCWCESLGELVPVHDTVQRESRQMTEWEKCACGTGTAVTLGVHLGIYKHHWAEELMQ